MTPPDQPRRLCLVTGASAGLGAGFARIFAQNGYDLVLTARRGERLRALAQDLEQAHGARSLVVEADLAQPGAVQTILASASSVGRPVSALVNNAGYGLAGSYTASRWEAQQAQLQVLIVAVCELTRGVLPQMRAAGFGRVLNVASVAGLVPGSKGDVLYGPSKAFVVKFSQAIHLENRLRGVHVTALCPGYTYTEFHDVNDSRAALEKALPKWMWLQADKVVQAGYRAVEANRPVCIPGLQYRTIAALMKLAPEGLVLRAMRGGPSFIRQ